MTLPNFLIVGAARSGTTALYEFLKQHPDISFPRLKEPKYFSSIYQSYPHNGPGDYTFDKSTIKDFEKYKNLFKNFNTKLIGEASPDYLYFHEHTAKDIYSTLGDIKIIIILRNPALRAFSAYSHLIRDNREYLSFEEGLKKEDERINNNYDFIWHYKNAGLYFKQVKTFKEQFSNVHIIFQEKLKDEPTKTMGNVFHFLGVNIIETIDFSLHYNPVGKPKNKFFRFLLNRQNKVSFFIREFLKKTIPRKIIESTSSKFIEKTYINKKTKQKLFKFFLPDIEKLENYLGYKINLWHSGLK